MKFYKKLAVAVSSVLVSFSFQANAATSIAKEAVYFNVDSGSAEITLNSVDAKASWVSESMGFLGWTHFSKWGFMDLKKGQSVTITLDATAQAGVHPATTVWYRNTKKKANDPSLYYMDAHSYNQSGSVSVRGATDETTKAPVDDIIREFVANAVDADGLGDKFDVNGVSYGPYMPLGYNTPGFNNATKLNDKPAAPGKVTMTFTAPKTGVYQFAVGALKPDASFTPVSATAGNKIDIKVSVSMK
jgi:hypothetical protein